LKGKQQRSSIELIERRIAGGEKSRKKFGGRSGKNDALNERRSNEQEKKLRSDAGEIEKKKGVTSSSSCWL
jgi:hypothetical protein